MKGGSMKKQLINYETLLKVTKVMSMYILEIYSKRYAKNMFDL